MSRLLWICLGGAVGTGLRYGVSLVVQRLLGSSSPVATFAVNVTGSAAMGALIVVGSQNRHLSPTLQLAMTTGLLGGFTTYSTFSFETLELIQRQAWVLATIYVLLTVLLCLAGCALGYGVARAMLGPMSP
jgi:CrcB protein